MVALAPTQRMETSDGSGAVPDAELVFVAVSVINTDLAYVKQWTAVD
jgi:hypothetical protein